MGRGRLCCQPKSRFSNRSRNDARASRILPSADGVPALGKRQQRPGLALIVLALVVVGGARWLTNGQCLGQKILLGQRNRRGNGIQQKVEISFTHRALPPWWSARSQNCFVVRLNGSMAF